MPTNIDSNVDLNEKVVSVEKVTPAPVTPAPVVPKAPVVDNSQAEEEERLRMRCLGF